MPLISNIPDGYKEGFEKLAALSSKDFKSVLSSLESSPLVSNISGLSKIVSTSSKIDESDLEDIFMSVGSLIPLLDFDEEISEVVDDIVILNIDNGVIKDKDKSFFREKVNSLIKNERIFYSAKADDLLEESSNLFITCKVVTDIRPIFPISLEESATAGIIIHNLHIHYQSDNAGTHQDIYLSLSPSDIIKLKEALSRAEKKQQNLEQLMKKAGMRSLLNK